MEKKEVKEDNSKLEMERIERGQKSDNTFTVVSYLLLVQLLCMVLRQWVSHYVPEVLDYKIQKRLSVSELGYFLGYGILILALILYAWSWFCKVADKWIWILIRSLTPGGLRVLAVMYVMIYNLLLMLIQYSVS